MSDIPAEYISKQEAIELTAMSPRTFERNVKKRKIEQREHTVSGRRPIIIYLRSDIEDLKRNTVVVRPDIVPEEREQKGAIIVKGDESQLPTLVEQPIAALLTSLAQNLSVLPLQVKLTLTLKEAVAYSGLAKATITAAIHANRLAVIHRRPYRIRRTDIDAFVSQLKPVKK